jgi:predicted acylesterase/phospholipase RssA
MDFDMVFEGGGAKGMVFVGAIQALEAKGHTPARLLGTSAGAILATFLAAGYSSQEMVAALSEKQNGQSVFLGFLEIPATPTKEEIKNSVIRKLLQDLDFPLIPEILEKQFDDGIATVLASSSFTNRIYSFIERGGFYAADNFLKWLQTKLDSGVYPLDRGAFKNGDIRQFSQMNLAEFFEATGVHLSLIAADTSDSQMLILNQHTAPNCPLVWAVRMSMSVPLLWQEVIWQTQWGKYRGKDLTGNTIVDGGLLSNFPIELFLSNQTHVVEVMGEKSVDDLNVLGFLIDETLAVPDAPAKKIDAESQEYSQFSQLQTVRRLKNLLDTVTIAHDKMVIEASERFVIRLPAKGYGATEYGMSDERRNAVIAAARDATERYFKKIESATRAAVSFAPVSGSIGSPFAYADRIASRILSK